MNYYTAGTGAASRTVEHKPRGDETGGQAPDSAARLFSDRRIVILTLTKEGMALTQDLHRSVQAYDTALSEGVSAQEMAVFTSVTSKCMANYASLAQSNLP